MTRGHGAHWAATRRWVQPQDKLSPAGSDNLMSLFLLTGGRCYIIASASPSVYFSPVIDSSGVSTWPNVSFKLSGLARGDIEVLKVEPALALLLGRAAPATGHGVETRSG